MEQIELIEWLFENGGTAIRYRTAVEFLPADHNLDDLEDELLASPLVRRWLENLHPELGFNQLHGAAPTTFESAMGKLTQLGCRRGMEPFDKKTEVFRHWFQEAVHELPAPSFSWTPFLRVLVGAFLSRAGYWEDSSLKDYLDYRLEVLYQFARQRRYDLHVDPAAYPGIPQPFRGRPLIDPVLTAGGEMCFPLIYDLHLLANVPDWLKTAETQAKIDSVISYVLDPAYQALPEGYGIIQADKRKYYAMGWSAHLPGYDRMAEDHPWAERFVKRLVLMSNFAAAREHRWFKSGVRFLARFRTGPGTHLFPRALLPEKPNSYWVSGACMGLEENRRRKLALALESTFWMMMITKSVED
jgi:hypothetical protein